MTDTEILKVGDFVYAEWMSREGPRWIRGEISRLAGYSIYIRYYYEHNNGGQTLFGLKTARRRRGEVRKVERGPDELRPMDAVDARMEKIKARRAGGSSA